MQQPFPTTSSTDCYYSYSTNSRAYMFSCRLLGNFGFIEKRESWRVLEGLSVFCLEYQTCSSHVCLLKIICVVDTFWRLR